MKVVLLSFFFEDYTIQLANGVSKYADVTLMLPRWKVDPYRCRISPRIRLMDYRWYRMRSLGNVLMLFQILRNIVRVRPDVIHLQEGHPWFNFVLPLLGRFYPIVNTVHDVIQHTGDELSRLAPQWLHSLARWSAKKIIVHGECLRDRMLSNHSNSPEDIFVIPHGNMDIHLMEGFEQIETEDHTILFFGRIWAYKGLQYLIKAEPFISSEIKDVNIIIAGTGEDLISYEKMMENKERFEIHNKYIPDDLMNALYLRSSLVVLPYIEASQSGVVPAAYSFGKPVVVTDVGSISEAVIEGKTGLIVPPRDVEKLAEAIVYLLKHKKKREDMGKRALERARGELSWDRIGEKTVRVYRNSVADHRMILQEA